MLSVNTMRRIDKWLGIPLCFFFDLLRRLFHMPRRTPLPTVQRVCFIELSEAGSSILAASAVRRCRELFPDADLYWLIFERHAEGLRLLNLFPDDHILTIRATSLFRFLRDTIAAVIRLRRLEFDTIIDLELFSRFTALLGLFSGAVRRVGFTRGQDEGLYRGHFLTHEVLFNPYLHMSCNFHALVEALQESEPSLLPVTRRRITRETVWTPSLPPSEETRGLGVEVVRRALPDFDPETERLVVLNPDPGVLKLRGWPADRYAELADRLLHHYHDVRIAVIGLEDARLRIQTVLDYVKTPRCASLMGHTRNTRDLLGLFHISALVVTNDSGPAHLAGIAERPVIVLFGPETPVLYEPLGPHVRTLYAGLCCSPCYSAWNHRSSPCLSNTCLHAISVEEVFEVCEEFLDESRLER